METLLNVSTDRTYLPSHSLPQNLHNNRIMSAFNDYCIVCEKLCTDASAYCSEECRVQDTHSHFSMDLHNVPQLISPMLQPRADSLTGALQQHPHSHGASTVQSDDDEDSEPSKHQEYLIKSPMLLSSTLKNEENSIAGLSLNDCTPRESDKELDQHHAELLAASSNYYKKWLNVNHI